MIWEAPTGEKNMSDNAQYQLFKYSQKNYTLLKVTQDHSIFIRIHLIIRILKVSSLAPQNPQKAIRGILVTILNLLHFLLPLDVGHVHR